MNNSLSCQINSKHLQHFFIEIHYCSNLTRYNEKSYQRIAMKEKGVKLMKANPLILLEPMSGIEPLTY